MASTGPIEIIWDSLSPHDLSDSMLASVINDASIVLSQLSSHCLCVVESMSTHNDVVVITCRINSHIVVHNIEVSHVDIMDVLNGRQTRTDVVIDSIRKHLVGVIRSATCELVTP